MKKHPRRPSAIVSTFIALLAALVSLGGCGGEPVSSGGGGATASGGSGPGSGSGGEAGGVAASPLIVTVTSATLESSIGTATPGSGNLYLLAATSLASTADVTVSMSPLSFSLVTRGGVAYLGEVTFESDSDVCRVDASVVSGGTATCNLIFVIPQGATADRVVYTDTASGLTSSTPVPAPADEICIDFEMAMYGPCGDCVHDQCPAELQQVEMCPDANECELGCNNPDHSSCDCEAECPQCGQAFAALRHCAEDHCLSTCL